MKKILIMGSFVVDLMGRAEHLPKPGETVKGNLFKAGPGGKGSNQAVAAKRLGADIRMATKVGEDDFGRMALKNFKDEGFESDLLFRDAAASTGTALILVDEKTGQNSILVTLGACEKIGDEELCKIREAVDDADILLTQLETNLDAVEEVIRYASSVGKLVMLNPAPVQPIPDELYRYIDIITPNEVEAGILAGIEVLDRSDAAKAASFFLNRGVGNVVVTMGGSGVFLKNADKEVFISSRDVEVVDTTGAGDAFNGALAAALAEGMTLEEAAGYANAAAALSVTKMGTAPAMPYRDDVAKFLETSENSEVVNI